MIFLVDYENVNQAGLAGYEFLRESDTLIIFMSDIACTIQEHIIKSIAESGCSLEVEILKKRGKDALDFYIATRVGELFGTGIKDEMAIVSKDSGYDAVKDYWSLHKRNVVRAGTIARAIRGSQNDDRKSRVASLCSIVNIKDWCDTNYEKIRIDTGLHRALSDIEYPTKISALKKLIISSKGDRIKLYQSILKEFGSKNGRDIYNRVKELV